MSENDYKRIIEKMDKYIASIPSSSPNDSLKFLINAGICTKKGNIRKNFQK